MILFLTIDETNAGELMEPMASISAPVIEALLAAVPSLEKQGVDVRNYAVEVWDKGASLILIFENPNKPAGLRGSAPEFPSFEVELEKESLTVIGAHFVR